MAQSGRSTKSKSTARVRSTTRRGRAVAPVSIRVSSGAEAGYAADGPVSRVVEALGNNVVADLLGVNRSQPSRWRSGQERLSPESRKRISDLDHVLDRLLLELHPDQAGLWLIGPNPHLGGARPIDVLELRGAATVLPAIDALAAGAFA
ncbi:MAG: antitoxin Xre/MbcA/ParS toxin-binding domain-containing protein [Acidimicrobiales bacterium]